ncbi:hypothetical protein [Haliovirga abyssi]|uniref:Uncharacterized protein n=1 Tax=Haliovirga abyssi TaxID=2996794 RepID=A0AAU9E1U2_9FUSO|nr:hypothetical protein [Haliovirga abyssi]BDU50355.1 hypothetical protein HLVA_09240 [Haliovirga abyssi]
MRNRHRCGMRMSANKYLMMKDYETAYNLYKNMIDENGTVNDYLKYIFILVMLNRSYEAVEIVNKILPSAIKCKGYGLLKELIKDNIDIIRDRGDIIGEKIFKLILGDGKDGSNSFDGKPCI